MSQLFDYIVNGGDENALLKAQLEHMGGALEREIEENKRLRDLILDGCAVFEHYDLPEHAFHYRRILERGTITDRFKQP